jgi:hypothetical protein
LEEAERLLRQESPNQLGDDAWDNETLRADQHVDAAAAAAPHETPPG